MNTPAPPSFVRYSTPESRAAGIVSLLAVAETLICVVLYWLLWLKWGVTWHHWLIVLATPLVLMRSRASVKKGLEWFDAPADSEEEVKLWSFGSIAFILFWATCAMGVTSALAQGWLTDHSGWAVYWRSIVVGLIAITVACALLVAFSTTVAKVLMKPVSGPGSVVEIVTIPALALGFGLRALAIRSAATFLHPFAGLKAIPENWQKFVWSSDCYEQPKLLPEHEGTSFHTLISEYKKGPTSTADPLILTIFVSVLYVPTLLWRLSIKSTAWFYLPLLWIGRGWQNIQGDALSVWAKGYSRKWLNIIGALLATFLLLGSFVALIVPSDLFDLRQRLDDAGAPLPVIGWAFVLDWQSLAAQPWQWFYLPSWVLTLILFFMIDDHGVDIEKGAKTEERLPALRRWMWISNARTVLTNLGLLVALFYFLAAVDAWAQVVALFS